MTTTTPAATPPRRSPMRLLPLVLAGLALLGLLAGLFVSRTLASSYVPYKGTQVLGVIPGPQGATAEGSVSAASQWATVGASAPFLAEIAASTGQERSDVERWVKVALGEGSPTITVTATGDSEQTVDQLIAAVSAKLGKESAAVDARYPLKPLTPPYVASAKKPSTLLPALGAGLFLPILGLVLFFELTRRAGRHAREV